MNSPKVRGVMRSMGSPQEATVTIVILLVFSCRNFVVSGYFFSMISESQFYVASPGDPVSMECNFHADGYDMFEHPVIWRKQQLNESFEINILGTIIEPFSAVNRFEVAFNSVGPRYQLELSLKALTVEDSGNYTCEIRSSSSAVLASVIHFLFVRAPVESVRVSAETSPFSSRFNSRTTIETPPSDLDVLLFPRPSPSSSSFSTSSTGQHHASITGPVIRLVENRSTHVRCSAVGGYPPPRLELSIVAVAARGGAGGGRDVTSLGMLSSTAAHAIRLSGSKPGFRRLLVVSERTTVDFVPTAGDDGGRLNCQATVPGLQHRLGSIGLSIDYSPKITCHSTESNLDDINVALKCDVRAKPRPAAIYWIVSDNGTALKPGEVTDDFWSVVKERKDGSIESTLYVQRATPESFRKYTIVVENSIDTCRREVELVHKFRSITKPLSDAASSRSNERVTSRDTGQQRIDKHTADKSAAKSQSSVREAVKSRHPVNSVTSSTLSHVFVVVPLLMSVGVSTLVRHMGELSLN